MEVRTFAFDLKKEAWSQDPLPQLDSSSTLILAFGAPEIQNQHAVFQRLRAEYPNSRLVGCSTAGEILNGHLRSGTLAVAVMKFQRTSLATAAIVVRQREQSEAAAKTLGRKLLEKGRPTAILFLGDGVLVDQQAVVQGLNEIIGPGVSMFGAFAGDGDRFERPWVLVGNRLQSGLCAAVAFYGDALSVSCAMTSDWGSAAPRQVRVTKSEGNMVYELDQMPAIDVCGTQNGTRPLRAVDGAEDVHYTPVRVDPTSKAIAFHRPVPEGTDVFVIDPDADAMIRGAADVAREVRNAENQGAGTSLAFTMSSVGRRLYLGQRAGDEVVSLAARLAPETPNIGLYSYGALSPCDQNTSMAQNSGLSLVMLGERDSDNVEIAAEEPNVHDQATRAMPPDYGSGAFSLGSSSGSGSGSSSGSGGSSVNTSASEVSLSTVRPAHEAFGSVHGAIYRLSNELRLIVLEGTINETFDGAGLAKHLAGRVILDLGGIEQITSFGVRGWLEMMSAGKQRELYLASCSEVIVNQMLMVRNFSGGGHVVSFGAPYICTACSNSFEFNLDISTIDMETLQAPADVACPDCGNRAVFDDDPESFFEFLGGSDVPNIPGDVRAALADRRLESMSTVEEAIQKQVEGLRTSFRINRNLDEKIRWSRVFAGVEGVVRLDFSGSREASEVGIDRMVLALRKISESVKEILLDQVGAQIVERLSNIDAVPKLRVRSLTVPASCTNCGVVRLASVDAVQIREAKRHRVQPEADCRRCSASIPLLLPDAVVDFVTGSSGGEGLLREGGNRNMLLLVAALVIVFVTLAVLLLTR